MSEDLGEGWSWTHLRNPKVIIVAGAVKSWGGVSRWGNTGMR